jgi:hypothetical protein
MSTRSHTSFQKRQKELHRSEKQREKAAKRLARKLAPKDPNADALEPEVLGPEALGPEALEPNGAEPAADGDSGTAHGGDAASR